MDMAALYSAAMGVRENSEVSQPESQPSHKSQDGIALLQIPFEFFFIFALFFIPNSRITGVSQS